MPSAMRTWPATDRRVGPGVCGADRAPRLRRDRALAERLGVDPVKLDATIEGGPLDAPLAGAKLHKMERGDFSPEFPLEWGLKDVDLALAAAGEDSLPALAALSRAWHSAVEAGHGREDVSAAVLALSR
jgi:3-hydroxyisobutyrate dehydrogenase